LRLIERGGEYCRVADPGWVDPLDRVYSRERGGRWNPPGSFGVVYLNSSIPLARAQMRAKLGRRGIEPEDLLSASAPVLIDVRVPSGEYVDVVTAGGIRALALPASYPRDAAGHFVSHADCQPIGVRARRDGHPGIACRPAVDKAPPGSEELAYFGRRRLSLLKRRRFEDWY